MDLIGDLQQVAKDAVAAQAASFHKTEWTRAVMMLDALPKRWDRECCNRFVVRWSRRMELQKRSFRTADRLFTIKQDAMRWRAWAAWLQVVEIGKRDREAVAISSTHAEVVRVMRWSRRMELQKRSFQTADRLFTIKQDAMRWRAWAAWLQVVEIGKRDREAVAISSTHAEVVRKGEAYLVQLEVQLSTRHKWLLIFRCCVDRKSMKSSCTNFSIWLKQRCGRSLVALF